MAKVPFTPDGVKQKQDQLYSLSDDQLLQEARLISQDILVWATDNFDLSADQVNYFSGMSELGRFAWGAQFAAIVIGRGPVTMDPPIASSKKVSGGTVSGGTTYNPNTGQTTITVGGTITFGGK